MKLVSDPICLIRRNFASHSHWSTFWRFFFVASFLRLAAKTVNLYPSKLNTQQKLDFVQIELDNLKEEEIRLDLELEMRDKQVQLLLQSIFDLKNTLLEDEEDKANTSESQKSSSTENLTWADENPMNEDRDINTLEAMDTTTT